MTGGMSLRHAAVLMVACFLFGVYSERLGCWFYVASAGVMAVVLLLMIGLDEFDRRDRREAVAFTTKLGSPGQKEPAAEEGR